MYSSGASCSVAKWLVSAMAGTCGRPGSMSIWRQVTISLAAPGFSLNLGPALMKLSRRAVLAGGSLVLAVPAVADDKPLHIVLGARADGVLPAHLRQARVR